MERVGVIIAGGRGERFWPKSNTDTPKQFLKLFNNKTLIENTVERILPLFHYENIFIVTGEKFGEKVKEIFPQIPEKNIILEPIGKNTAPAIALAYTYIKKYKQKDVVMGVFPADHFVKDVENFQKHINTALYIAEKYNALVTIGITPNRPETGYGYIKQKHLLEEIDGIKVFQVEKFVEKPTLEKAIEYISSGDYLWNSGMFFWKLSVIEDAFRKYSPNIYNLMKRLETVEYSLEGKEKERIFKEVESISVDYGIMEKAEEVICIKGDFLWDDVGSWNSIYNLYNKDENGNVVKGNVILVDTKNSMVLGDDDTIAVVGFDNIFVIKENGKILILNPSFSQKVREVVKILEKKQSV